MKDIPGFEDLYSISLNGEVLNKRTNKNIKGSIVEAVRGRTSYKYYSLRKEKKSYTIGAHRLVAMTFIGDIKKGQVVNHIDGDGLNNNLSNLEIISIKKNILHGAILYDVENIIQKILLDYKNGISIDDIAFTYKRSIETVKSILSGNNYYELKVEYSNSPRESRLMKDEATAEEINEIYKLYSSGEYLQRDLVEIFKITRKGIRSAIRSGESRKRKNI